MTKSKPILTSTRDKEESIYRLLPSGLRNFCWPSDRSRSLKKPLLFEIRVTQRIEFNGFSSGGENAAKISPAGDVFGACSLVPTTVGVFVVEKMNTNRMASGDG